MKRTWKISWFVWNNGKGVKKTVDTNDYPDTYCEKYEVKEQAYIDHDLHPDKIVMIKQVM